MERKTEVKLTIYLASPRLHPAQSQHIAGHRDSYTVKTAAHITNAERIASATSEASELNICAYSPYSRKQLKTRFVNKVTYVALNKTNASQKGNSNELTGKYSQLQYCY